MAVARLATSLLATLLVRGSSAGGGGCASTSRLGGAVCEEVNAETDVGVELLQVDKIRVARAATTLQRSASASAATIQGGVASNATSNISSKAAANDTVATEQAQANGVAASSAKADSPSFVLEVQAHSKGHIPSLGDIIQQTKDAADSIAGEVVDQVQQIGGSAADAGLDSISDLAGSASTTAALEVAEALNNTLLALDEKAVQWRASCYAILETAVDGMNVKFNNTLDELRAYEAQLQAAINHFLPYWGNISEGVRVTTTVASGVLKTLGQNSYVNMLNESVTVAMGKAGEVVEVLANTTKLLNGLGGLARDAALKNLLYVNATLENALDAIEEYAEQLEVAFEDLTDQAAAGLESTVVGVNASAVDTAFSTVRLEAAQVVQDLFNGPAALVTGLTEATTQVVVDLGGSRSGAVAARSSSALLVVGGVFFLALQWAA